MGEKKNPNYYLSNRRERKSAVGIEGKGEITEERKYQKHCS